MENYDAQCVVWQTALAPALALKLLATGVWSGTGVHGPEAFDAKPFLDLMAKPEAEEAMGKRGGSTNASGCKTERQAREPTVNFLTLRVV